MGFPGWLHAGASEMSADQARLSMRKGLDYLLAAQEEDGSWRSSVAVTSLAATAFLRSPFASDEGYSRAIDAALAYVVKCARPDGGIFKEDYPNYSTSLAVMALAASRRPEYGPAIRRARGYLSGLQMDESDGVKPADPNYGGVSYDGKKPPDLSNTHFAIEAIATAGLPKDDPFFEKAVVFLERLQNRRASNDQPYAGDDGGFFYAKDESKAGQDTTEDGGRQLRSYGSMTYAGLLSYIYAGVRPEDERVRAAYDWVRTNYTLDENPGVDQQGLFYYFHTFAKTLAVMGVERVADASGEAHDWRADLVKKLAALQREDGSWVNAHSRWMEADPVLVTAYGCLSLAWAMR